MRKSLHIEVLEAIGAALLGMLGICILSVAFVFNAVVVTYKSIRPKTKDPSPKPQAQSPKTFNDK